MVERRAIPTLEQLLPGVPRAPEGMETLLRQILDEVGEVTIEVGPDQKAAGSEVIFQVDIDGQHYTLVRQPALPIQSSFTLSPREREIIHLVAKGLPNKIIALVLDISPWTVATHLRRVFGKLKVSSRAEMIARVLGESLTAEGSLSKPHR